MEEELEIGHNNHHKHHSLHLIRMHHSNHLLEEEYHNSHLIAKERIRPCREDLPWCRVGRIHYYCYRNNWAVQQQFAKAVLRPSFVAMVEVHQWVVDVVAMARHLVYRHHTIYIYIVKCVALYIKFRILTPRLIPVDPSGTDSPNSAIKFIYSLSS